MTDTQKEKAIYLARELFAVREAAEDEVSG